MENIKILKEILEAKMILLIPPYVQIAFKKIMLEFNSKSDAEEFIYEQLCPMHYSDDRISLRFCEDSGISKDKYQVSLMTYDTVAGDILLDMQMNLRQNFITTMCIRTSTDGECMLTLADTHLTVQFFSYAIVAAIMKIYRIGDYDCIILDFPNF